MNENAIRFFIAINAAELAGFHGLAAALLRLYRSTQPANPVQLLRQAVKESFNP